MSFSQTDYDLYDKLPYDFIKPYFDKGLIELSPYHEIEDYQIDNELFYNGERLCGLELDIYTKFNSNYYPYNRFRVRNTKLERYFDKGNYLLRTSMNGEYCAIVLIDLFKESKPFKDWNANRGEYVWYREIPTDWVCFVQTNNIVNFFGHLLVKQEVPLYVLHHHQFFKYPKYQLISDSRKQIV